MKYRLLRYRTFELLNFFAVYILYVTLSTESDLTRFIVKRC